jgi:outer membrane protein TolC
VERGLDLAARVSRRQAAAAIANLEQLIELDVWLAINEFERARQQIAATQATHYLQEETLKAEKERFDVGAGTALLVAQAQRDLLLSAIDEIEAVINCRRALVKLYVAEGSLLERRGVRLAGP